VVVLTLVPVGYDANSGSNQSKIKKELKWNL